MIFQFMFWKRNILLTGKDTYINREFMWVVSIFHHWFEFIGEDVSFVVVGIHWGMYCFRINNEETLFIRVVFEQEGLTKPIWL